MFQLNLQIPGDYTLVAYQRIDSEEGYVLVQLTHNKMTPFVTWRIHHETGHCEHGDYLATDSVCDALDVFEKRCKRLR